MHRTESRGVASTQRTIFRFAPLFGGPSQTQVSVRYGNRGYGEVGQARRVFAMDLYGVLF